MNKDNKEITIYILSDSIGETAQRMVYATLAQFPRLEHTNIKKFPYIKSMDEFKNILNFAKKREAIIVTTLVNEEYNQFGKLFAKENDLAYVDYMTNLINIVQKKTDIKPSMESGALRKLDDEYFKRIAAIEYSVKYDDGKNFQHLEEADALILGVSRTSKTPLSMYLANKGYKIANIPLVPEAPFPEEVFKQKGVKVFGLTASPNYIMNIRTERVKVLGINGAAGYNNLKRIKQELTYAEEIFKKMNAIVINTEYRSIEESAFYIEKYLNN